MVTATRTNLTSIERFIDTLKAALNRQVLVEARIIEVQLDDSTKFGIDWSFLSRISDNVTFGGGFGNALSGTNLSATLDGSAKNFRIGAITSGSKGNITGLLTALNAQGEVKTLSIPRSIINRHKTKPGHMSPESPEVMMGFLFICGSRHLYYLVKP